MSPPGHHEAHGFAERMRADETLIGEGVGSVLQRIGKELEKRPHRVVPLVEPARLDDPKPQMPALRQRNAPNSNKTMKNRWLPTTLNSVDEAIHPLPGGKHKTLGDALRPPFRQL